ncbi:sensor domain-containing diguanylate cyclase [Vibrio cholerae]|nr:sensor domain-containing diguanylate cyclase [Vibrio cholerae]
MIILNRFSSDKGFGGSLRNNSLEDSHRFLEPYYYNPRLFVLLTLAYIFAATTVIHFVTSHLVDQNLQRVKENLQHELSLARYRIEATVFKDTYLADSLATLVTIKPEFAVENWQSVADKLISKARVVRNVAMAPNDIISQVYPLYGNQGAIGLNFRDVPSQYKSIQEARKTKSLVVNGPVNLVQGGTGLIVRYPIFTDSPLNLDYWGTVSVVLDYDLLLHQSKLFDIQGASIALLKLDPTTQNFSLIEGRQATADQADISYPIYLPYGQWELRAQYQDLTQFDDVMTLNSLFATLGAVTFFVIYVLLVVLVSSYIKMHKLSLHDELTGLPNRRFLLSELERLTSDSSAQVELTILNIDLNDFKLVNDSYGHDAGDALLKHVAHQLTHLLRSSDLIARVGGDEFVVVLHRTSSAKEVEKIINKIHDCFVMKPLNWKNTNVLPSLSLGAYSYKGEASQATITDILSRADASMYRDKMKKKAERAQSFMIEAEDV